MKVPCTVVGMIAEWLCNAVQEAVTTPRPGDLAQSCREFIEGQLPALISFHVLDRGEVGLFLTGVERLAKAFAVELLNEEEG